MTLDLDPTLKKSVGYSSVTQKEEEEEEERGMIAEYSKKNEEIRDKSSGVTAGIPESVLLRSASNRIQAIKVGSEGLRSSLPAPTPPSLLSLSLSLSAPSLQD
jgi:hypothetical protein